MPFIGGGAIGWPAKWWGRLAPHCGQMASTSSRYFDASYLIKNEWPLVEIRWRNDLSRDGGGNGGDGGDRSDGLWLSGSRLPIFLLYTYVYLCNAKIFDNTMKYKKMNEWYF